MSTCGCFLFVGGYGRAADAKPAWPNAFAEFVGSPRPDGTWVAWRLLGGNNWELGRSARVFEDLFHARNDAAAVREAFPRLVPEELVRTPSGLWSWRVSLDGEIIAAAARGYQRAREAVYSQSLFISGCEHAQLSDAAPSMRAPAQAAPIEAAAVVVAK